VGRSNTWDIDHPEVALADRGRGVVGHPSSRTEPFGECR
jgi:hypothetical protein